MDKMLSSINLKINCIKEYRKNIKYFSYTKLQKYETFIIITLL